MLDAVVCIALDTLGATVAIAHGDQVLVIDQTTICTRAVGIPRFLLKQPF